MRPVTRVTYRPKVAQAPQACAHQLVISLLSPKLSTKRRTSCRGGPPVVRAPAALTSWPSHLRHAQAAPQQAVQRGRQEDEVGALGVAVLLGVRPERLSRWGG